MRSSILLLLLACHAPEPNSVEVPKADAAAPGTTIDAPTAPSSSASAGGYPPSGLWNVTVTEKSTTCFDAGLSSATSKDVFVPMRPWKDGKHGANLPISPLGSVAQDRSDVVLEVGQVQKAAYKPDKSCNYEIKREIEVTTVSADKIAIALRSEYGDGAGCARTPRPVSCKHEVAMTFTLTKALCDPKCGAEGHLSQDGGMDVKCLCPDAGP